MADVTVPPSEEYKTAMWRVFLVAGAILFVVLVVYEAVRGITALYNHFAHPAAPQQAEVQTINNVSDQNMPQVPSTVDSQYNIIPLGNNGRAGDFNNQSSPSSSSSISVPAGIHPCPYRASDGTQLWCDATGFYPFQPSQNYSGGQTARGSSGSIGSGTSPSGYVPPPAYRTGAPSGAQPSVQSSGSSNSTVPTGIHPCPYRASDGTQLWCDATGFYPFQPSTSQQQGVSSGPVSSGYMPPPAYAANNASPPSSTNQIYPCPYRASDGTQLWCDATGFYPFQLSQ